MSVTRILSVCWQLCLIYAASTALLAWPWHEGPAWLLAVGACQLCRTPGREGIVWLMGIGLLLDALSQTQLGLHLAVSGLTASVLSLTVLSGVGGRWWKPSLAAGVLAGMNHLATALLQNVHSGLTAREIGSRWNELLLSAANGSVSTALVVMIATTTCCIAQRAWNNGAAVHHWELGNQWARLTEG